MRTLEVQPAAMQVRLGPLSIVRESIEKRGGSMEELERAASTLGGMLLLDNDEKNTLYFKTYDPLARNIPVWRKRYWPTRKGSSRSRRARKLCPVIMRFEGHKH